MPGFYSKTYSSVYVNFDNKLDSMSTNDRHITHIANQFLGFWNAGFDGGHPLQWPV
jgi:hypothetical protein